MGLNHVTTGLGALLGSAFYNAVALISAAAGKLSNALGNPTTGIPITIPRKWE